MRDERDPVTPETLAALHADAFDGPARWSPEAFGRALSDPACFFVPEGGALRGFGLGRVVADEAELLTLVVALPGRRHGLGRRLVAAFEAEARARGATEAFLEVSVANVAARRLYEGAGWRMVGRRVGYYEGVDALTFRKPL
ncbi:GNAT family N-acetyltransferase [Jannaschia sp. Os4]|uniref:GNAT family N-acetyltransferase n=1 Tax=Jannaschia sp. Os4 TaxID=2807617 RepID=UPI001939FDA1|nr:GNAT family N-acetyltransferase [Jannaschia sp. Os4]MBM2575792.1 GNAT family N-acetyltransferase [Jannaschia sp. Os4]